MRLLKGAARSLLPAPLLESLKRRHYARALRRPDFGQSPEHDVVRGLVRAGDVVLDVGANIGVYTRLLAELVGPTGRVLSLEPVPVTCRLLHANVASLGLKQVAVHNLAASDREGRVRFEIPAYSHGGDNYYRARVVDAEDGPATEEAACTTLDRFVGGVDPVDADSLTFIKCDVEGHELACLRGARQLLTRARAAWLVEVSGDPDAEGDPARLVLELVQAHGYTPWWYDGAELRPRQPGDVSNDYFFLREDHLHALRRAGLSVSAD